MKRKHFLQYTVPAATVPFFINGIPLKAFGKSPLVKALMNSQSADKILVIVQLSGGNYGVNTVLPIDQYQHLSLSNVQGGRSNILIPENKGLYLSKAGVVEHYGTKLNPGMTSFQRLYGEDKLGIIQSVGYANPNFSHFRATDIWMTGSDANKVEKSGWAGRNLNYEHPDFISNPTSYPLAITIGSTSSSAFMGPDYNMGIAINNPNNAVPFIGNNDVAPPTIYGHELSYIRNVMQQTNLFGAAVKDAYEIGSNSIPYPNHHLANQLKTVARLISGGLETKLYLVNIGGFDTHANQENPSDLGNGHHSNLWKGICDAIATFQDDLANMTDGTQNLDEKVIGFTFSEFGRTIKSNTTNGTDHGTTGPMFLFGKKINSDMLGTNPDLFDSANNRVKADLPVQFDFRSVYASILTQWFSIPKDDVDQLLFKTFEDGTDPNQDIYDGGFHCNLPILKGAAMPITSSVKDTMYLDGLGQNYPNPFSNTSNIDFESKGEQVIIRVYNMNGALVKEITNQYYPAGKQTITLSADGLAKGVYTYQILQGKSQKSFKLQVQ
jgi:uncharacterized protein (DUF1501 family)